MYKQRLRRAALLAVCGLAGLFALPAAAQAHHIVVTASCDSTSTVNWRVDFVSFGSAAKPTTTGSVKLDGNVVKQVPPSAITWTSEPGRLSGSNPAAGGQAHVVLAHFSWKVNGVWESDTEQVTTNKCPAPKNPALTVTKDGPSTLYVGHKATFTYKVKNTGDVTLTTPVVTDDKCSPVTKVAEPNTNSFDPGDTFTYTCTLTITDGMGNQLVNVASACGSYGQTQVCDTDTHTTQIPKPGILLTKTGAASANAGDTVTYSFAVQNTGNVPLALDAVADDKCIDTPARAAGETDTSFEPGDTFNFTCTYVVPAGVGSVLNKASVCGTYMPPEGSGLTPEEKCSESQHEFPVPAAPSETPGGSTPEGGGVLPETIASGLASLRGPSGCVKRAFRASVRGRSIASVAFFVDGKLAKRITGTRSVYSIEVNPRRYGFGRHRVVARVQFVAGSGTRARRLPLTFRRCAQGTIAPRFTG